jgi:hypothetical protein
MIANPTDADRGCGIPMRLDLEELFDCINGIRNAYTAAGDRQPLCFDHSERRGSARIPLTIPVQVIPVVLQAGHVCLPDAQEADIPADTTNLSLRGMGFRHVAPFPHRHAAITFKLPASQRNVSLLVELRWTSPANEGCLHSGARFLGLAELPERTIRHRD